MPLHTPGAANTKLAIISPTSFHMNPRSADHSMVDMRGAWKSHFRTNLRTQWPWPRQLPWLCKMGQLLWNGASLMKVRRPPSAKQFGQNTQKREGGAHPFIHLEAQTSSVTILHWFTEGFGNVGGLCSGELWYLKLRWDVAPYTVTCDLHYSLPGLASSETRNPPCGDGGSNHGQGE